MARRPTLARRRNPTERHDASCSCGKAGAHPISEHRQTADGINVLLWSDGAITDRAGSYGVRGKRGTKQVDAAVTAGWAVMRNVELYDFREIPAFARRAYNVALANPSLTSFAVAARATRTP